MYVIKSSHGEEAVTFTFRLVVGKQNIFVKQILYRKQTLILIACICNIMKYSGGQTFPVGSICNLKTVHPSVEI